MKKILIILSILLTFTIISCGSNGDNSTTSSEDSILTRYDINGFIQKGPFIRGSTITIQELDNYLIPTGRTFNTETYGDSGVFSILSELASPYVEIIANGFYFNEITGELSPSRLTLRAVSDLTSGDTIFVNILTHLEKNRVLELFNSGNSFAEAKEQARSEILSIFNLNNINVLSSDKMDITKSGDSNAVLLAPPYYNNSQ